jgi:hypothetical protein
MVHHIQNTLIFLTPEFIVKDVVSAVCERRCIEIINID